MPQLDKTALENAIKLVLAKQEKVEVAVDAISVEKGNIWLRRKFMTNWCKRSKRHDKCLNKLILQRNSLFWIKRQKN